MAKDQIAAVILAAGSSTRFGSPKQLAKVGERTMLEAVVAAAAGADLDPIIAVVPSALPVPAPAVAVVNDRPAEGLSRSLRLGLAEVPAGADAAVILLGDQPTVSSAHLRRLVDGRGGPPVVATVDRAGLVAPPVLLERSAFALVDALSGDEGLGRLLAESPELVATVSVRRHAPDVDVPEDITALDEPRDGTAGPVRGPTER